MSSVDGQPQNRTGCDCTQPIRADERQMQSKSSVNDPSWLDNSHILEVIHSETTSKCTATSTSATAAAMPPFMSTCTVPSAAAMETAASQPTMSTTASAATSEMETAVSQPTMPTGIFHKSGSKLKHKESQSTAIQKFSLGESCLPLSPSAEGINICHSSRTHQKHQQHKLQLSRITDSLEKETDTNIKKNVLE
ncbi:hypothetical protein Q8A67_006357 [Cirrhinus molitorella]|uniref:Uncharacterized protein n=1 Tax=Cirrhinus molitorella TaxID=172907 RepID=A0AA88TSN9_9TELE|nr:hypothetical protein Q8A67_006357 [Cirrhinus molitorella]